MGKRDNDRSLKRDKGETADESIEAGNTLEKIIGKVR